MSTPRVDLQTLPRVGAADVYKAGRKAGQLRRARDGGVSFSYSAEYLGTGLPPVALSLPFRTWCATRCCT